MAARALALAAFAFFLVPTVAAVVPLDANLRSQSPTRIDGVLTLDPAYPTAVAFLRFDGVEPDTVLFEAGQARIRVHRWERQAGLDLPSTGTLVDLSRSGDRATGLRLGVAAVEDSPQAALIGGQVSVPDGIVGRPDRALDPDMSLAAGVQRCDVQHPKAGASGRFPEDARSVGPGFQHRPMARRLVAECQLGNVSVQRPALLQLYGLDLWLESSEGQKRIRTGTFEESPTPGGPTKTITQILEVQYEAGDSRFTWDGAGTFRVFARSFLVVGHLALGAAEGRISWGSWDHEGSVESVEGTGGFRLAWEPNRVVSIDGYTLEGPGAVIAGSPAGTPAAARAAAVLVSLALLALAAVLASRLPRDRLAEHPRRSEILDLIRRRPGLQIASVAESLGIRWLNASYHVQMLRRGGHLSVMRLGGRKYFFPALPLDPREQRNIVLLQRESLRRVFRLLAERPGLDQSAMAQRLGLTQSAVSKALGTLCAHGLVQVDRRVRRKHYFLATRPD